MARNRSNKDYYAILGVPPAAAEAEIRKAYRKLALETHPDRNQNNPAATERFKEISEAYGVLIDPSKRLQYDAARQSGAADSFTYTQDDILRDLFRNPRTTAVFEELAREFERMGMRVDRQFFDQVLFGGRTRVTGGIFVVSPFGASGVFHLIREVLRTVGILQPPQPKTASTGSKVLSGISKFGNWLLGKGDPADVTQPLQLTASEALRGGSMQLTIQTAAKPEQVMLTIPPGIGSGTKLRLKGKGRFLPDGTRGDLYLRVEVN